MSGGHLGFDRDRFFAELEPRLVSIATKYGSQDASGEARSWWEKFARIYDSINSNPDHVIFQDLNTGSRETDLEEIKRHLVGYMITGFKHELIRRDSHDRHADKFRALSTSGTVMVSSLDDNTGSDRDNGSSDLDDEPISDVDHQTLIDEALDQSKYTLDDLLEIIRSDLSRLKNPQNVRETVMKLFIAAIGAHYCELREELGNVPIVRDLAAEKPKRFFVREIFEGRIAGVKAHLEKLHALEPSEPTKKKLYGLLDPDDDGRAFRQKLVRYFSEQHGGLHKRLLRKQNENRS